MDEITPENSVVPIFLDPTPEVPPTPPSPVDVIPEAIQIKSPDGTVWNLWIDNSGTPTSTPPA